MMAQGTHFDLHILLQNKNPKFDDIIQDGMTQWLRTGLALKYQLRA